MLYRLDAEDGVTKYLDQNSNYRAGHLKLIADSRANWVDMRDHQPADIVKRIGKMDDAAWNKYVDTQIAFWDRELAGLSDEDKRITRNYVAFDPSILKVTHKNGQALTDKQAADILASDDFNPSEPRKDDGEWTSGGGVALKGSKGNPGLISTSIATAKASKDQAGTFGQPNLVTFHDDGGRSRSMTTRSTQARGPSWRCSKRRCRRVPRSDCGPVCGPAKTARRNVLIIRLVLGNLVGVRVRPPGIRRCPPLCSQSPEFNDYRGASVFRWLPTSATIRVTL
jgi:hypothetical protein